MEALNTYNPDGSVAQQGSIIFESGGLAGFTEQFTVIVQPAFVGNTVISGNSGVSFIGNPLDPITLDGVYIVRSGFHNGSDPRTNPPYSSVWANTVFRGVHSPQHSNGIPLEIRGGNTTVENCTFATSDPDFATCMTISDLNWVDGIHSPFWHLVFRNCRFEAINASLTNAVDVRYQSSLTIENCHFEDIAMSATDMSSLMEIRDCGIASIRHNTARDNVISALRTLDCWATTDSRIRTNDSLPLVSTNIYIYEDSSLTIEPGSVLKFYDFQSGLVVHGDLAVDSAVLTGYRDDQFGGDTDYAPEPASLWPSWNTGGSCGIYVDATGSATITSSRVRYAQGGIRVFNDITLDNCVLERCSHHGLWLNGESVNEYRISNTTIRDVSGTAISFRSLSSHSQLLELSNVSLLSNQGTGLEIFDIGTQPTEVVVANCRIVGNQWFGISFPVKPSLVNMSILNSVVAGNWNTGIVGTGSLGDTAAITIAGNVVFGNGQPSRPADGIDIGSGRPSVVCNTVGYNRGRGLNIPSTCNLAGAVTTNNIFFCNRGHGLFEGTAEEALFAANAFWGNTDGALIYRGPDGWLYSIAEVQALGGDYATNIEINPGFVPEITGEVGGFRYDHAARLSILHDPLADFAETTLADRFICPDTAYPQWFQISHVASDSLFIYGDISDYTTVGHGYRIFDFHLSAASPLIDAGHSGSILTLYDIDGDMRLIDGNESGVAQVDIGADEFAPEGGSGPAIRITTPVGAEVLLEGDVTDISWQSDLVSHVNILYSGFYSSEYTLWDTVIAGVDATDRSYMWTVPYDLTMGAVIRIEDSSDSSVHALSQPFIVKEYVLTRKGTESLLIRYWPQYDSWRFGNDSATMWPESWYAQFDYVSGVDPFTGSTYPLFFSNALFYNARSSDFPSWPTFVGAFGSEQCYMDSPQGPLYRVSALNLWSDIKNEWNGSCFGFGASSPLAFFDSAALLMAYPEVGAFGDLHDLDTSAARREAINQLCVHQYGIEHRQHQFAHFRDTPRQTLAGLIEMTGDNFTDGRMLAIGLPGPNGGGHVVNPYRLARDSTRPGRYLVFIYDSNNPVPDTPAAEDTLVIDSTDNTWFYSAFPNWTGPNAFCFLMDSSASYLRTPTVSSGASSGSRSQLNAGRTDHIRISSKGLTRLLILDDAGNMTGYDGVSFNNDIPDATPIMALTGRMSFPRTFVLPAGAYTIDAGSADHTTTSLSVWDGSLVYRCSRTDVGPDQTDRLNYDSSLVVVNSDDAAKVFQLACAIVEPAIERQYVIKELSLGHQESLELLTTDGQSLDILNRGGGKVCALELWSVASSGGTIVQANNVILPSGALITVVPNWAEPGLSDTRLLIDYDVDGSYDDTLLLDIATFIDEHNILPNQFGLSQNYPNPFNPATTIEYSLPGRSRVNLSVYNVMGQLVQTLINGEQSAGSYKIEWDGTAMSGSRAATGVYFYRLQAGEHVETRKMLLLR